MSTTRSIAPIALLPLLATATLLGGCAETDPGSALIKYRIGNDKTCAEAGVDQIKVTLDEEDGIDETFPCGEGEFLYEGIPVGKYTVIVEGIDDLGVTIVDNIDAEETKLNISGDGSEKETNIIALTDSPAKLRVRWDFGFASCESVGVESFLIEAYDSTGSNQLLSETIDCTTPGEGSEGYRAVPDPDRELLGGVFGEVGVRPQDASGGLVGQAVIFGFTSPMPGYTISTTLVCDEAGCTGSGSPD
jgi:hypothetical protein